MLLPDLDAGCSLADSITAEQLRAWKAEHPGAIVVMYVNTTAEVKAETDYCVTSSNAVAGRRAHLPRARRGHRDPVRPGHVPRRLRREADRAARCTSGTASATCTPASARRDIADMRAAHPGADFLIHPECGCSTSVMEYVAAGDVDPRGRAHALDRRDARLRARRAAPGTTAIVATETGMLHPLRDGAPGRRLRRRQRGGQLPLHEDDHAAEAARRAARRWRREVKVPGGDRRARAAADRAHGRDRLDAALPSVRRCTRARPSRRSPSPSAGLQLGLVRPGARRSARRCRRLVVVVVARVVVSSPWSSSSPVVVVAVVVVAAVVVARRRAESRAVVARTRSRCRRRPCRSACRRRRARSSASPPSNDAIVPAFSSPSSMPSSSVSASRGFGVGAELGAVAAGRRDPGRGAPG